MNKLIIMEFSNIGENVNVEASYEEIAEICKATKQESIDKGNIKIAGNASKGLAECYRRLGLLLDAEKEYYTALNYFNEIDYTEGIAWTHWALGNLFRQNSRYSDSVSLLNKALQTSIVLKDYTCCAYSIAGIAEANRIVGSYNLSINQHLIAQNLFHKLQDYRGIVWAKEGIAQIYKVSGYLNKALPIFYEAKQLAEDIRDLRGLGYADKCIGEILCQMNHIKLAIESIYKSIRIFKKIKLNIGLAYSYKALADAYYRSEDFAKSLHFYNKANFIFKNMNDGRGLAYVNKGMGDIYLKLDLFSQANNSYLSAKSYFQEKGIKYGKFLIDSALSEW